MTQRGKVLRDTSAGTGLISANGKQYEFTLEGEWRSDSAPTAGMIVEFATDEAGKIVSVTQVNESQLAKEQADKLLGEAKVRGAALVGDLSARMGKTTLIAWAAVCVSWFFMSVMTVDITAQNSTGITFWDFLLVVNQGQALDAMMSMSHSGERGVWALLALAALAGPAVPQFWKDGRAYLGYLLPAAVMVGAFVTLYMHINSALSQSRGMAESFLGANSAGYIDQMVNQVMNAIHVGAGGYIALIASAVLLGIGVRGFLVAQATA